MSYKALYRTHRPTTFNEVVGQDHITNTLKNIILKDRVSHAYLFAGPRGTGKTSVAHVFANTLNCSDIADRTTACGNCEQCQAKNSMDIVEIDAASNNGVSDIRTLIENAKYAPSISKYKVYIIDEVHMLSKGAFNALLKTLEEPPKHVVFILATTEPHKIPVTILSRTQRFNFRRITEEVISKQLVNVLTKEAIDFDEEAIRMIAKLSNGGMRDALSIADQTSAFSNGRITFEAISQVFGIISTSNQIRLLSLGYSVQSKELLSLATEFIDNGGDIERMTVSLIDILKDFIVFSKTGDVALLSLLNETEVKSFAISVDFAYGAIDILMKLLSDLRLSEVPRQAFELALLKITDLGNPSTTQQINPVVREEPVVAPVIKEQSIMDSFKEEIVSEAPVEKSVNKFAEELAPESSKEEILNKVIDVFSTQELNERSDEIFTEEKLDELQEEIEATGEFEIPQQILDDQEETSIMSQIDDDILSTQEIPIKELTEPQETTQEIDVMGMFSLDGDDLSTSEKPMVDVSFSVDEILNLLVQADRDVMDKIKRSWSSIMSYSANPKYGTYANLLEASKIISVGQGFILLSSTEKMVISQINSLRKDETFIEFLEILFGEPLLLFAITREEFEVIKNSWKERAQAGTLPKPSPVEKLMVKQKEMSEAESFGTSIFGDILNS